MSRAHDACERWHGDTRRGDVFTKWEVHERSASVRML